MANDYGGETFMDLRIRDLTKEFGDFKAVDHFSYDLRCGVYGLLGVNGAGKTLSLIHISEPTRRS